MHLAKWMGLSLSLLAACASAQTKVEFQPIKELKRTGSLGTCNYMPTEAESPFFGKLDSKEKVNGSLMEGYDIHKKQKKHIAWFGIVRGIVDAKPDGSMTLLIEHKYFDGLTDCHIMLVSHGGSGDFHATIGPIDGAIVPLSLVRVYGEVDSEKDGIPHVVAEYVRVWPWMTFTLTDLGPGNKGNPEWEKYCRACKGGRIYNPYPDKNYYLQMLGDPKEFGTVPQTP